MESALGKGSWDSILDHLFFIEYWVERFHKDHRISCLSVLGFEYHAGLFWNISIHLDGDTAWASIAIRFVPILPCLT